MNIAIIGAGCVGSVLAEHFIKNKENTVSLIAFGDRAAKLEKNGIKVNGVVYHIPVFDINKPKPDLVFVCVKNYDLYQACEDLQKCVDNNTIILPLLNSVSPTPTLQEFFPNNRVLYGYISKIDAHEEDGGYRYNIAGEVHFGYKTNKEIQPEIDAIRKMMEDSSINCSVDVDMLHGIWKKWMLNVGANQISALTEANYLQFAQIPEIEKVLRLAMQELLMIACYEKVNLGTNDITELIEYLTTYPYPKQTSMLQDILAKRKTEIDYISGDIVRLSNKWNCPCPVNLTMFYLIKSKEKAYLIKDS